MPDEIRPLQRLSRRLDERNGWARSSKRTSIMTALNGADYLSMVALFIAWVSAILFISNEPNWGIVTMFGAFLFDKLDGYWARRQGASSAYGRQIDSFIDIFAYLVTGALLFHYELAPNAVVSAVVGFAIFAFGGLRLVRHNTEGFDSYEDVSYYHGTTVVHTNTIVLANYVLISFMSGWSGWYATALVLFATPWMVSEYRAPKTVSAHVLLGLLAVCVIGVCLGLEFDLL